MIKDSFTSRMHERVTEPRTCRTPYILMPPKKPRNRQQPPQQAHDTPMKENKRAAKDQDVYYDDEETELRDHEDTNQEGGFL